MSEIRQEIVKVTTTGSAGSASGSETSKVLHGLLEDIYLDYHASAPATTDLTVAFAERGGNILEVSNNVTDGLYHPGQYALNGRVTVNLAQCNALTDAVTAYIRYLAS